MSGATRDRQPGGPVFGDMVRAHRRRCGLSQEELAQLAGINVRSLGKIEAGRTVAPRPVTLRLLADAFGLTGTERERFCRAAEPADRPGQATPVPATPVPATPVPAQLPADVSGFTGRAEQLARLDGLLAGTGRAVGPVPIAAVVGPGGVGKTALAVHWAHRVRADFPDGQLYANLRGFDPAGPVLDPAHAVRGFLTAFGLPPQRIPADLDAQTALYRSIISDKRVLVLLDNARSAAQVRPLLPGTGTAVTVVTSRDPLSPLVAAEAAEPVPLDVLSPAEAHELLIRRLGPARLAAAPAAAAEIVDRCAGLPLALAILAGRARQSGTPLAALAADLTDAAGRLDMLDAGDPGSRVRAVFSWSYDALSAPAARLFRLLGLHPGPDTGAAAAASLAGRPLPEVRSALAELTRVSLIAEDGLGRYAAHDLLRAYAADLGGLLDTAAERRAATGRLVDHYVHTGHAAAGQLMPYRDGPPVPLPPPAPGCTPERPADPAAGTAWLAAEAAVLLAAVPVAAAAGLYAQAWHLAWALDPYLDRQGRWPDQVRAWRAALPAAERLAVPAGQAHGYRMFGHADTRVGRWADAHAHYLAALELYTQAGHLAGQASVQVDIAHLWERQGHPARALRHDENALALYRAAGHRRGQAYALNFIGWCLAQLGDLHGALDRCREGIALFGDLDDAAGAAMTWDSLGYAHLRLGEHAEAVDCYRRAVALFRDVGDRYCEADTLAHLGDAEHAAGDPAAAGSWRHALAILIDLDHPDAHDVRARLRRLEPRRPGCTGQPDPS